MVEDVLLAWVGGHGDEQVGLEVGGGGVVHFGGGGDRVGGIVEPVRKEHFVGEADVVVASLTKPAVAVVGVDDGDLTVEEACQIGGPHQLLLALPLMGEGEEGVLCVEC